MRPAIFCPTWEEAFERAYQFPYDNEWYEAQQEIRMSFRHRSRIYDIGMESAWERRAWRVFRGTPNASATARPPCESTLPRTWDVATHVHNSTDNLGGTVFLLDLLLSQCLESGLGLFFPTTEGVILAPVPAEFRTVESRIMLHDFGGESDKNDLREVPSDLMPQENLRN